MRAKKICTPMIGLVLAALLAGCGPSAKEDDALALQLRSDFLSREGYSGTMEVTADYDQRVYTYTVDFVSQKQEGLTMTLRAPESLAGLTAHIAGGQTQLEFDGVQLETGPLNQEGLSPMDALPALMTAMESGYISDVGEENLEGTDTLRICCRDPEKEAGEGLETILWFSTESKALLRGELRSDGYTVVRCVFSTFVLQLPNT